MARLLDNVDFLLALNQAGVDNWEWYDECVGDLPDNASDEDFLRALDFGGVDNWEGFNFAIDIFNSWQEDSADDEMEPEEVKAEVVEPKPEPLSPGKQLLLDHVGKEKFNEIEPTVFKRYTHPKEFDKSLKILQNGGTLEEAQLFYVETLIKKKLV